MHLLICGHIPVVPLPWSSEHHQVMSEPPSTSHREVSLSAGLSHVRSTLLAAALPNFSRDFSDVTLVFNDGNVEYYRAFLYLFSPWWKELLIQVHLSGLS